MIYVCDNCGQMEVRDDAVPEGDEWTCANCESNAAWEFPPERSDSAANHAAHIALAYNSRLFHARRRDDDSRDDATRRHTSERRP